ncbi:HU family DNA-binding protein [Bacteroides sp. 214]|uniref:HU family DNA-binding protein n=1 Tax=Bacteroides sp. 214 TaxID=2302935 RepID=UPI0013D5F763|nr:HU family DNA-binding protein [Bacteroides sp. 214]NDW13549.1 HU family DNA-binding protein [Bacteroides sp. 214]
MNKAELISAISTESGLNKTESKKALNAFISSVIKALVDGDKVSLAGFGTFSVIIRQERPGINPTTKASIIIPETKVAKFKAGLELSNLLK